MSSSSMVTTIVLDVTISATGTEFVFWDPRTSEMGKSVMNQKMPVQRFDWIEARFARDTPKKLLSYRTVQSSPNEYSLKCSSGSPECEAIAFLPPSEFTEYTDRNCVYCPALGRVLGGSSNPQLFSGSGQPSLFTIDMISENRNQDFNNFGTIWTLTFLIEKGLPSFPELESTLPWTVATQPTTNEPEPVRAEPVEVLHETLHEASSHSVDQSESEVNSAAGQSEQVTSDGVFVQRLTDLFSQPHFAQVVALDRSNERKLKSLVEKYTTSP